jgi:arabinose-5-phosphate isomerase
LNNTQLGFLKTINLDKRAVLQHVRDALQCESEAIAAAASRVDDSVADAIGLLENCQGRLIVTGMGKMGLVGRKAAATFSSTGAPAIFLHPVDALHGDLGVVTDDDVVLALSNSGATEEVITLLTYMRRRGVPVIALTGRLDSPLAQASSVAIDTSVEKEADPISVAPTASSTLALAMCDALAVALMHVRGFTPEQFAEFHPGGNLGKKLLTSVADVMQSGERLPVVTRQTKLRQAIVVISEKALGCAFVLDSESRLQGILTDGDLRRVFEKHENPLEDSVSQHMTREPSTIGSGALAAEALKLMQENSITVLPVVDNGVAVGVVHLHQLLAAGLA